MKHWYKIINPILSILTMKCVYLPSYNNLKVSLKEKNKQLVLFIA